MIVPLRLPYLSPLSDRVVAYYDPATNRQALRPFESHLDEDGYRTGALILTRACNRPGTPVPPQEYKAKYRCTKAREIFINPRIFLELGSPIRPSFPSETNYSYFQDEERLSDPPLHVCKIKYPEDFFTLLANDEYGESCGLQAFPILDFFVISSGQKTTAASQLISAPTLYPDSLKKTIWTEFAGRISSATIAMREFDNADGMMTTDKALLGSFQVLKPAETGGQCVSVDDYGTTSDTASESKKEEQGNSPYFGWAFYSITFSTLSSILTLPFMSARATNSLRIFNLVPQGSLNWGLLSSNRNSSYLSVAAVPCFQPLCSAFLFACSLRSTYPFYPVHLHIPSLSSRSCIASPVNVPGIYSVLASQ
ncbi:hypothetical protein NMY22_g17494 [Coprinellus aureogranulatus]|nr:hypothetical protein NMY22_g17494 [Coprinellus aureogranulatus]